MNLYTLNHRIAKLCYSIRIGRELTHRYEANPTSRNFKAKQRRSWITIKAIKKISAQEYETLLT